MTVASPRLSRRLAEEGSDSDSEGSGRKACDRSKLPRRIAEEDSDSDGDSDAAAAAAAAAAVAAAAAAAAAPPAVGARAIGFQCIDHFSPLTDLEVGVTLLRSYVKPAAALDVFVVSHVRQWRRCGDFAQASPSALKEAASAAALSKIRMRCGGAILEWKVPRVKRVSPQKLI